ncbi:hypothetical protein N7457_003460 [Penicillium paradoxum]|uniref:uncharacterized protein n=1 Tax=Penicillium paradoxum TaxID=176176 RepID=UPI002546B08F|nr:uncharacterized protein N7457_003460 [Penicillium paradoxum]KAJ5788470.1 hypothetical protein N7457_003460 [Penicillium paradoxum]
MVTPTKTKKSTVDGVKKSPAKVTAKTFTRTEIYLYHAIKYGGATFDYKVIAKELDERHEATRMRMSRFMKEVEKYLAAKNDLAQSTSTNPVDMAEEAPADKAEEAPATKMDED